MSLLSHLLPRAGHSTTDLAQPKGIPSMETLNVAQPLHRIENKDALPLPQLEHQDEGVSPLRCKESTATTLPRAEDEAQTLHRTEAKDDAQSLHRVEVENEAQPVHRTQAPRAADDDAPPLHRTEEEDAHPSRRMDKVAPPMSRLLPPDDQQLTAENSPKPAALSSMAGGSGKPRGRGREGVLGIYDLIVAFIERLQQIMDVA